MLNRNAGIHAIVTLFALLLIASPGSAAKVTKITWDVTGGYFYNNTTSGTITGGKLVYTPSGGSIQTPQSSAAGGTLSLSLTGQSWSFTAKFWPGAASNIITAGIQPSLVLLNAHATGPGIGNSGYSLATPLRAADLTVSVNPSGAQNIQGDLYGFGGGYFSHTFALGNEVRSPEAPLVPATTGFGQVLLALGLIAGGRAFSARVLKHRRG